MSSIKGRRDGNIDFLRGLALLMIFVDHVPYSLLSLFTVQSFAFSDAAELFFFLSGYVAALVFLPYSERNGIVATTAKIWKRVWTIYTAQMVLALLLIAAATALVALTAKPAYLDGFRLTPFFNQTDTSIIPLVTLRYQPIYLDILPVYVLFFLTLPLILFAIRKDVWLAFFASLALYFCVQEFGWTFRTYPWNAGWMFNPLAWQIIFVLGILSQYLSLGPWASSNRWIVIVSALIAACIAGFQFASAVHNFFPAFPTPHTIDLPIQKENLGWLRLVSFAAIAITMSAILPYLSLWKGRIGRAVVCCGRNPLPVFCLGAILSIAGQVIWIEAGKSYLVQAAYSLIGIAILLGFAQVLEWMREPERFLAHPPEKLAFAKEAAE